MAVMLSLPSIHELFPEHLLPPPKHAFPAAGSTHHSFNILRSDPACSSLTHIASSASLRPPPRRECTPLSSEDDEDGAKRHVCRTCHKRFNRPSSLRIHINTHTGATPFRCPFPGCRREFNVNSNMRRHYRNHASPQLFVPDASPSSERRLLSPPLHVSPRPYLVQKRCPVVNRSEYVWHPAEEEMSQEREYVRRRTSDIRTTSDGET
ncbi:hypothetical protein EDD18DRAFT_1184396 [Armillaria luteobubalina]|uniref:C2H2-type domain-containing protein n=1 Tax=Armillaria luteobubalina TaxID=153913 RepID=A0AA39PYK2_9AGAR|nr:hypothetical protein EDD18DRAFT_1184396 [Armillaria luteobubalina]